MSFAEVIILAFALSMDAFAVAVATGIRLCQVSARQNFRLSFHFGLFQCLMPIVGWLLGLTVKEYIEAWDHWLAFALLAFVGGKMIWDALTEKEEQTECIDPTKGFSLVILSVATSLDALAVGLSLAFLGHKIWLPAVLIGIICAGLTCLGLYMGKVASSAANLGPKAALAGGIVLILIGVNILREHGVFAFVQA